MPVPVLLVLLLAPVPLPVVVVLLLARALALLAFPLRLGGGAVVSGVEPMDDRLDLERTWRTLDLVSSTVLSLLSPSRPSIADAEALELAPAPPEAEATAVGPSRSWRSWSGIAKDSSAASER